MRDILIGTIVQNEALRNEQMILEYVALLDELPKGSLICRKNEYYYLKYRENRKLHDKYIGKDAEIIADIKSKLELRKHYTQMLSALKREQTAIHRILEGLE